MPRKEEPKQYTRKELNLLVFMHATGRPHKSKAAICERMKDKGLLAGENQLYVLTDLGRSVAKQAMK